MSFDRKRYIDFVAACSRNETDFALTVEADASEYARCFGVFSNALVKIFPDDPEHYAKTMRHDLRCVRAAPSTDIKSKPYRQLLAFTLSALAAIGRLSEDPLADLVEEQLPRDTGKELRELGCLDGKPGSGNQAMFLAVFLLHARDWLGGKVQHEIDEWLELHIKHMNQHGFWGPSRRMTHLQFQNGYHQHEILEYLGVDNPKEEVMINAVASLADSEGRFAPYPGGGGCYDYDAIFLLTPHGRIPNDEIGILLANTANSIIAGQNADGGFCESHYIRPRTQIGISRFVRHIAVSWRKIAVMKERVRYGITLQRPKHDRIHTHWSQYSRRWNESDLWDTWFRALALARIECAVDQSKISEWGFIDYPGIGFHPSLHDLHVS